MAGGITTPLTMAPKYDMILNVMENVSRQFRTRQRPTYRETPTFGLVFSMTLCVGPFCIGGHLP